MRQIAFKVWRALWWRFPDYIRGKITRLRIRNRVEVSLGRPGLYVTLEWRRDKFLIRPWLRFTEGFATLLPGGHLRISVVFHASRFIGPVVRCSDCGRMYGQDQQAPPPGAIEWATLTKAERDLFTGFWYTFRDWDPEKKEYFDAPPRWIGPCCESRDSGGYDGGWDPDEDEELDYLEDYLEDYLDDLAAMEEDDGSAEREAWEAEEMAREREEAENPEDVPGAAHQVYRDFGADHMSQRQEVSETAWDDRAEEMAEEIDRIFREENPEEYEEARQARIRAGLEKPEEENRGE